MRPKNSYRFDSFRDQKKESDRLDLRATVGLDLVVPTLKSCGLQRDMRVLDVGAGTGRRTLELAKFLSRGEAIGIDTSRELLNRAEVLSREAAQLNLSFKSADVLSNSSLKRLGHFDFIHMRLVAQHLPDPIKALANLRALLTKRGRIFVEDTDRNWMNVYPCPSSWEGIYQKMKRGQSKKGGDPNSGHKLGHYLSSAGFEEVSVRLIPVSGGNDKVLDWVKNYAPSYINFLSGKDAVAAQRALVKISIMSSQKPMFFFQTWFQATGRVG